MPAVGRRSSASVVGQPLSVVARRTARGARRATGPGRGRRAAVRGPFGAPGRRPGRSDARRGGTWRALEDLLHVPGAVVGCHGDRSRLRADQLTSGERQHLLPGRGAVSHEALGDQYPVAVADPQDALVEELVVQGAEAESVVEIVRT